MTDMVMDKKERLLLLFGLRGDFTAEELAAAYRTLAKLNHPDVNRDTASEMRMVIINDGYHFLQEFLKNRGPAPKEEKRPEDLPYKIYRNAFTVLNGAFSDYFGETVNTPLAGDLGTLRARLRVAKREFSRIVSELPYNQWVDDAIDKINSINKWL